MCVAVSIAVQFFAVMHLMCDSFQFNSTTELWRLLSVYESLGRIAGANAEQVSSRWLGGASI